MSDDTVITRLPAEVTEPLLAHLIGRFRQLAPDEQLCILSDAVAQWQASYMTDPAYAWTHEPELLLDRLTLTGTGPAWNEVILNDCHRSPVRFRGWLAAHPGEAAMFDSCVDSGAPILVRLDHGQLKVLDGMHRTIARLRAGATTVSAYIGQRVGAPRPHLPMTQLYPWARLWRQGHLTDGELLIILRLAVRIHHNGADRLENYLVHDAELRPLVMEALGRPIRLPFMVQLRCFIASLFRSR